MVGASKIPLENQADWFDSSDSSRNFTDLWTTEHNVDGTHLYDPYTIDCASRGIVEGSDQSTALATLAGTLNTAGGGRLVFPARRTIQAANIPLYTNVTYDLNGCIVKLPNSAGTNADVFRTPNFDTLTGTGGTGGTYGWHIIDGEIDGNRANNPNGRHCIAAYGIGRMENLVVHDAKGNNAWLEWSTTATTLRTLGVANRDQTTTIIRCEFYNCESRISLPASTAVTVPVTVQNVTGTTTRTITMPASPAGRHMLRTNQVISLSGLGGLSGVPATSTVLSTPSDITFTVSGSGWSGTYTSGGTITWVPKANVAILGMDSAYMIDSVIFNDDGAIAFIPGQCALFNSSDCAHIRGLHFYYNYAYGIINLGTSVALEYYGGGQDVGLWNQGNDLQMGNTCRYLGTVANGIAISNRAIGGTCHIAGDIQQVDNNGLLCLRNLGSTATNSYALKGTGNGGTNTGTLYDAAPATGACGFIQNNGYGLNASPATWSA